MFISCHLFDRRLILPFFSIHRSVAKRRSPIPDRHHAKIIFVSGLGNVVVTAWHLSIKIVANLPFISLLSSASSSCRYIKNKIAVSACALARAGTAIVSIAFSHGAGAWSQQRDPNSFVTTVSSDTVW